MSKFQGLRLAVDNAECPERISSVRKLDVALYACHVRTSDEKQPPGYFKENIKNIYNSCVKGDVIDITKLVRPSEPEKKPLPSFSIRGH